MYVWKHFKTITEHKLLVMKGCFKVGLYRQGLFHDMSKYSPSEFLVGIKYYQGVQSPNNAERLSIGYSSAWLHHKGRNKHHLEYWMDYDVHGDQHIAGMRMPEKYVAEMVCDRIAASKVYAGEAYDKTHPWNYYQRGKDHYLLHPETRAQMEACLWKLHEEGEEATFRYIREEILKKAKR